MICPRSRLTAHLHVFGAGVVGVIALFAILGWCGAWVPAVIGDGWWRVVAIIGVNAFFYWWVALVLGHLDENMARLLHDRVWGRGSRNYIL